MIRPLWIEVDLGALKNNFKAVKKHLAKGVSMAATIKQSAYGHGLLAVAETLSGCGVDCFGVASVEEAIKLRQRKFKEPILILSPVFPKYSSYFLKYDLIPTVTDLAFAEKLDREAGKKKKKSLVHVKVDTGMGRLGFQGDKAKSFIEKIGELGNLCLDGIYTHFPAADSDPQFTNYQLKIFNNLIKSLGSRGMIFKFIHSANSIGILNYRRAHFNMVRPGLILYGIKPDQDTKLDLEPIMSLRSKVIFVKSAAKGVSIGYGRSYRTKRNTRIATVAIGYADGYPWALSNKSKMIIDDKLFKIAGRVCMDHIMVDLGPDSKVKPGDEVILIGKSRGGSKTRPACQVTVQDLAGWAQTIPYEIVSRLSPKIPRVYKS